MKVSRRTLVVGGALLVGGAIPLGIVADRRASGFGGDVARLAELGYAYDAPDALANALTAFQKAERLPVTGQADEATLAALADASRPESLYRVKGRHLEVDLSRQVALLVDDGDVVAVLSASGADGALVDMAGRRVRQDTPKGRWDLVPRGSRATLLATDLVCPLSFLGDYAIGGVRGVVPATGSTTGCVVVPAAQAEALWGRGNRPTQIRIR